MEIAYGHQALSENDPYLQLANQMNDMVAGLGSSFANPVDFFPICMSWLAISLLSSVFMALIFGSEKITFLVSGSVVHSIFTK